VERCREVKTGKKCNVENLVAKCRDLDTGGEVQTGKMERYRDM
jgi:hypothetical protein